MSAEWETGIGSSGPGAGMCMRDVTVRTPLTICRPSTAFNIEGIGGREDSSLQKDCR